MTYSENIRITDLWNIFTGVTASIDIYISVIEMLCNNYHCCGHDAQCKSLLVVVSGPQGPDTPAQLPRCKLFHIGRDR